MGLSFNKSVDISADEVVNAVVEQLKINQIFELIMKIDYKVADFSFTKELLLHFLYEMKAEYLTESEDCVPVFENLEHFLSRDQEIS